MLNLYVGRCARGCRTVRPWISRRPRFFPPLPTRDRQPRTRGKRFYAFFQIFPALNSAFISRFLSPSVTPLFLISTLNYVVNRLGCCGGLRGHSAGATDIPEAVVT